MEYLIVGLGNPGTAYANTRHNIGFSVVDHLAGVHSWSFKKARGIEALFAKGTIGEKTVFLLLPVTYMNGSGSAVQAFLAYHRLSLEGVCVVCDDIYLPFGRMKIKPSGGSGGHNGLKSLDARLGTQSYARLRMGVGDRKEGDLADHVLSSFLEEERGKLPGFIKRGSEALECFVKEGIQTAMQCTNGEPEEKTPEQQVGE